MTDKEKIEYIEELPLKRRLEVTEDLVRNTTDALEHFVIMLVEANPLLSQRCSAFINQLRSTTNEICKEAIEDYNNG